jgi:NAD(P)-dependent dehydrogenase (short-subunit alcohol dehydrogenase family)
VVLVTGGTGALGSAVSRAFLREGAVVAVTYRAQSEYDALKPAGVAESARVRGWQADVTDETAMRRIVAAIDSEFARLDALVNTVGGYAGGAPLWEVEGAVLERMLALNLRSAFVAARSVLPILLRQGRGAVVNVAAQAGVDQPGGAGAYVASKAAALGLMHSLAMDLKGTSIRVNSVLPNIIDTAANRSAMPHANFAAWAKVEDIAGVILYLCTPEAALIHGAAISLSAQATAPG